MDENFRYKTDKAGLVAVGDVHGNWSCIVDFCKNYHDFCIVQVGDFGIGFRHPKKEFYMLKKLNTILHESNNELIAIRGNHDNPARFKGKWIEEEILFADDYHILTFKDKKLQLIGGGISIDRVERIINRSWWEGEEIQYIPERVEKCDILITHIAPTAFPLSKAETNHTVIHFHGVESMQGGDLLGELEHEKRLTQELSNLSGCSEHIFGHYHKSHLFIDNSINRKYRCLDIEEFREIQ